MTTVDTASEIDESMLALLAGVLTYRLHQASGFTGDALPHPSR